MVPTIADSAKDRLFAFLRDGYTALYFDTFAPGEWAQVVWALKEALPMKYLRRMSPVRSILVDTSSMEVQRRVADTTAIHIGAAQGAHADTREFLLCAHVGDAFPLGNSPAEQYMKSYDGFDGRSGTPANLENNWFIVSRKGRMFKLCVTWKPEATVDDESIVPYVEKFWYDATSVVVKEIPDAEALSREFEHYWTPEADILKKMLWAFRAALRNTQEELEMRVDTLRDKKDRIDNLFRLLGFPI